MHHPICSTCGTQFACAAPVLAACPIGEDDRQYVGWGGQAWTTHEALAKTHGLKLADDDGVAGITHEPGFPAGRCSRATRCRWRPIVATCPSCTAIRT